MPRFGSDDEGFSVAIDEGSGTVKVNTWGFWSASTAGQFADAIAQACRGARNVAALALDATRLKPQREEGVDAFRSLMSLLPKLGIARATVTTGSPLTKLQLVRVAKDSVAGSSIQFAN